MCRKRRYALGLSSANARCARDSKEKMINKLKILNISKKRNMETEQVKIPTPLKFIPYEEFKQINESVQEKIKQDILERHREIIEKFNKKLLQAAQNKLSANFTKSPLVYDGFYNIDYDEFHILAQYFHSLGYDVLLCDCEESGRFLTRFVSLQLWSKGNKNMKIESGEGLKILKVTEFRHSC